MNSVSIKKRLVTLFDSLTSKESFGNNSTIIKLPVYNSTDNINDTDNDNTLEDSLNEFYSFWLTNHEEKHSDTSELDIERFNIHSNTLFTYSSAYSHNRSPQSNQKDIEKSRDKERLLAKIRNCYFESGEDSEADAFFQALVIKYRSLESPLDILSDIANHNIDDDHILEGILHILSNYDYLDINPVGISIVLVCVVNHSPIIQDLLISCFETWDSADGIDILEKLKLDLPWLSQYRDTVVAQLKRNSQSA